MSKHETLKPHIYLFDLMAEKVGQDLEAGILDGNITPDEIVQAAFRCSDCAQASTCEAVLPKAEHLEKPFEFCQNKSLFADKV